MSDKFNLPPTPTSSSSPSSEKLQGIDHGDESSEENLPIPQALIGAENYLTLTEGKLCALTKEELTEAVNECKILILKSEVCSDERKWLVRRLIELRYQLLSVDEVKVDTVEDGEPINSRIVLGHHLNLRYQCTSTTKRYCDVCCGTVWNFVQPWYQCTDCRYKCHVKCVDEILRPCPQLLEKINYESRICPEIGLASQNYQCGECKIKISFKDSWHAPRLCDYTGMYYCTSCHWNNSAVTPARVFRNWDFKPYLVCRSAYQLLRFTRNRTLITVDNRLYGYVVELAELKRLREKFSKMKSYLVRCRDATLEKKLLWKIFGTKSHLLEPSEVLSLRDLLELNSGKLLEQLRDLTDKFMDHITKSCKICSGQGYYCEFCKGKDDDEVIFPFYNNIYICSECSWVYHKSCWLQNLNCSKCERLKNKKDTNVD